MPASSVLSAELDPESQIALATALYTRVFQLLETTTRSAAEVDEMINSAHASRLMWPETGAPKNHAMGEWQIARVYSELGRSEPACFHARRCLELSLLTDEAWVLVSAYEGLARAYAIAGDISVAAGWKAEAVAHLAHVSDLEDREIVERDIASLPL